MESFFSSFLKVAYLFCYPVRDYVINCILLFAFHIVFCPAVCGLFLGCESSVENLWFNVFNAHSFVKCKYITMSNTWFMRNNNISVNMKTPEVFTPLNSASCAENCRVFSASVLCSLFWHTVISMQEMGITCRKSTLCQSNHVFKFIHQVLHALWYVADVSVCLHKSVFSLFLCLQTWRTFLTDSSMSCGYYLSCEPHHGRNMYLKHSFLTLASVL